MLRRILIIMMFVLPACAQSIIQTSAQLGMKCDGVTDDTQRFLNALGIGAGTTPVYLIFNNGTCLIKSVNPITVPSTLTLDFTQQGALSLASGSTMNVNSAVVDLDNHAVFNGLGTYNITPKNPVSCATITGGIGCSTLSGAGQFTAAAYGAVYDDSTDNCTAFTNLTTAAGAYAGPGIPSISFAPPPGAAGKAYKITSCNIVFIVPADIQGYGAVFDCQQSAAFANCVQFGPSNLVAFTNAQTPPYRFQDFTFQGGCVNVTVACIEAEPFVSNPQILRVHSANVGAGNGSPPACTNYFISFDGHNNAPQVIDNVYWDTDSTTGRCWMVNNRTAVTGGTNSGLFEHNTVIGAGNAPGGFLTPCGSIGHSELGSATIVRGNQFYGFDEPILLVNPQFGTIISANQIDQAGCLAGSVASADIHYGNASNGLINQVTITDNYFPGGAGHAVSAMAIATGSSSALSNISILGNKASGSAVKFALSGTSLNIPNACTGDCLILNNQNFAAGSVVLNWFYTGAFAGVGGQVAQAANLGAQTLVSSVPAAAVYRVSCNLKITQAATTSSTLPSCLIGYTDADTSTVTTEVITPTWSSGAVGCAGSVTNTVGNACGASAVIVAASSTAISYSTTGYASVGGTAMQYTIRARVEKMN